MLLIKHFESEELDRLIFSEALKPKPKNYFLKARLSRLCYSLSKIVLGTGSFVRSFSTRIMKLHNCVFSSDPFSAPDSSG